MSVTRSDIAAYLDSQFSALASAIGQSANSAASDGYGPDINLALRKLGKARADLATATVEDTSEETVYALAEYYAARRIWRQLSANINVKVGDSQFDYKTAIATAKELMQDAAAVCAALGYDVAAESWSAGWLNLDYLEPETAIGYAYPE